MVIASTWTVADLALRYIQAFRKPDKEALLRKLGRTKPENARDIHWLLNIYNRGHAVARAQADNCLRLLTPQDRRFGPFFLSALKDTELTTRMFGLLGAIQVRTPNGEVEIRAIASTRFNREQPTLSDSPQAASDWYIRFQALRALAQWGDPKAPALLRKRSKEAPAVATLLAQYFWEDSLEQIVRWSESGRRLNQSRAHYAWDARVPAARLRPTKERLFALLADKRKKRNTRHKAAIKLGLVAQDSDIDRLLEGRGKAHDEKERVLWTAALFASRHPRVIPILIEYVKTHKSAASRAGALYQLGEMMPRPEYIELLKWVADNDPDDGNRSEARRRLAKK